MTDYSQFYNDNGNVKSGTLTIKKEVTSTKRCSTNTNLSKLVEYAKKLNSLYKEVSANDICLDELHEMAKIIKDL
jgi:hypothetical protein